MPECPLHGGQKPCKTCYTMGRDQFANWRERPVGRCKEHGVDNPCPQCYEDRIGLFEDKSYRNEETVAPLMIAHTHGIDRPCKIRCGVNEGLYVLNDNKNVTELFTDGLTGCAQIVFRNATATFICHIYTDALMPKPWVRAAHRVFLKHYGAVTECYLVSGDFDTLANSLEGTLNDLVGGSTTKRIKACGGYTINISSGKAEATPSIGYSAAAKDVAGWTTSCGDIDRRLTGNRELGEALAGDYFEPCPACN